MLHIQTQTLRLCLEEVVHALTQHATAWKSFLLAHHHEGLRRQMFSLYKEQMKRWYVEAQHAVHPLS